MSGGPALVLGAAGMIGRRLVEGLLERGREVVAHARRPGAFAGCAHSRLLSCAGDLADPATYERWLRPETTVFLLAAVRNAPASRVPELERVNVHATVELARRCAAAGVARFVCVSSAVVFGPAHRGPVDESAPVDPATLPSAYARSRAAAVLAVRRLASAGLRSVVLYPTIVLGDGAAAGDRVGAEIRRRLRRRLVPTVGRGDQPRDLVAVEDVVRGLLAAERLAEPGEEFLLGGEATSHLELARLVRRLARLPPPVPISIPEELARALARLGDRVRGFDRGSGYTALCRHLALPWQVRCEKARRVLAYRPQPLTDAIARHVAALLAARSVPGGSSSAEP